MVEIHSFGLGFLLNILIFLIYSYGMLYHFLQLQSRIHVLNFHNIPVEKYACNTEKMPLL